MIAKILSRVCFVLFFFWKIMPINHRYAPTFADLKNQGMVHQLSEKDLQKKFIETSAGTIAYYETSGDSAPIILIHGNSCSKEYMIKQLDGLGLRYKMIALDLPGHGESANAIDPSQNYTLTGYAQLVAEFIKKLNLNPAIIVGWSLGGHIALEMMAHTPELLRGVLIASSTPFTPSQAGFQEAYLPTYSTPLSSKLEAFTFAEAKEYITQNIIDLDHYTILAQASMRAHGLARSTMVNAVLSGQSIDEKIIAQTSSVPLGIIMGEREHAINNEYTKQLNYANCIMMETLSGGHDCHWSHAEEFNKLVDKLAQHVQDNQ